jgi:sterol carrier protein 2
MTVADAHTQPSSQFQEHWTLKEVQDARMVFKNAGMTVLHCCPTSDGAGACILASEEFVKAHGLEAQAVEICAQV